MHVEGRAGIQQPCLDPAQFWLWPLTQEPGQGSVVSCDGELPETDEWSEMTCTVFVCVPPPRFLFPTFVSPASLAGHSLHSTSPPASPFSSFVVCSFGFHIFKVLGGPRFVIPPPRPGFCFKHLFPQCLWRATVCIPPPRPHLHSRNPFPALLVFIFLRFLVGHGL